MIKKENYSEFLLIILIVSCGKKYISLIISEHLYLFTLYVLIV